MKERRGKGEGGRKGTRRKAWREGRNKKEGRLRREEGRIRLCTDHLSNAQL